MTGSATTSPSPPDFFISRSTRDLAFARWVCALISAQGRSYVEQSEHFGPEDFMMAMHKAMLSGAKTVALYSQSYLDSKMCVREATEALKCLNDPGNENKQLIPLRIEPCAPAGMLNVTYTDLLAERRQADASALAIKICRALGLGPPDIDKLPSLPDGLLTTPPRLVHDTVRTTRTDLAPRPELMAGIASAMAEAGANSRHMVAAVAGMGGAGKTVLAREFAIEHQDAYHAVWWIDAERRDATLSNMLADLAALGAELSADIKAEALTNIEQAARKTLRLIESANHSRPFLLVYDNVERPRDIEQWTPRSGAHVLVTTRYAEWDPMVAKVDVGVLSKDVAVDFLLRRGRKKLDDSTERAAAETLAEALGYLPLALDHAASYCSGGQRVSFDKYLALYVSKLGHEPAGASESKRHRSVRATFALALESAIGGDATLGVKACPEAGIVMGVAALLAPVPISFALFSHPWLASADLDAAFRALGDVSLIAVDSDTSSFTVHRVVQAIMCDRLAEAGELRHSLRLANELLVTALPSRSDEFGNWEACKALTPHALQVLASALDAEDVAPRASLLAFNMAKYLQQVARYTEAEPLLKRSLAIDEKTVGGEHPDTSATLHALASLYQAQGRYTEAEPLLKRSLAINEKTVGGEHPDTSATLHALASLYQAQGRYTEAEPLLKRSLAINEKTVGGEHPDTSATLHELARLYQAQGRYTEAEPLLKRSLAIKEKTVGGEHPSTSATLHELARLYQAQGRYTEAEPLLKRSLAINEKTVGGEHPDTSATLYVLASLYQAQGRYTEAAPLLKRSLAIYEKTVGGEHPDTSATLHVLASLYQAQGRYTEAEPLLKRSLAIYEKTVGGEHPDTSATLHVLASLYQAQGRYTEAEPLLKRSLAIYEKTVGGEHPYTGITLRSVAELMLDAGRPGEARGTLDRARAVLAPHWEAEHVRWAQVLNVVALVEMVEGKGADAERSARVALERRLSTLSDDHPDVAQSKWTLARAMLALGRVGEAEPLLREAIATLAAKVTEEHVWLRGARATLAELEGRSCGKATAADRATPTAPMVVNSMDTSPRDEDHGLVGAAPSGSWWQRFLARRR